MMWREKIKLGDLWMSIFGIRYGRRVRVAGPSAKAE